MIFFWRWNHTPFDEATSNGHKDVADLLLEGIRHWEDDEERKIKEEFDSNDEEFVTNENSIASDVEPSPCEISNIIKAFQFPVRNMQWVGINIYSLLIIFAEITVKSETPIPSPEEHDEEHQMR